MGTRHALQINGTQGSKNCPCTRFMRVAWVKSSTYKTMTGTQLTIGYDYLEAFSPFVACLFVLLSSFLFF